MAVIPRQQVIPFTVLANSTLDLTNYTKYNHDKVCGVVLLPDKPVHGDRIYLEIGKETVLPHGFNAGLISFQQFLNKDIKRNVYVFEEWAKGSEIRIIYRNNDKRSVNIDLILFTVQGDNNPITKRKKLQIVPMPYTAKPSGDSYEPLEVRTKTNFYYDELVGVFNDHFSFVNTVFDSYIANSEIGSLIRSFLTMLEMPAETADEKKAKKKAATNLQKAIAEVPYTPASITDLMEAVKKTLTDYLDDTTPEPVISQKNLFALQETVETFVLYNDNHKSLSTLELTIDSKPVYPENYPVANIIPRYRKSFNETMHQCNMKVQEADIFARFTHHPVPDPLKRQHIQVDFSLYFLYHQTSPTPTLPQMGREAQSAVNRTGH